MSVLLKEEETSVAHTSVLRKAVKSQDKDAKVGTKERETGRGKAPLTV